MTQQVAFLQSATNLSLETSLAPTIYYYKKREKNMRILLLGDSIIDNAPYVKFGEPDVTEQVKRLLPGYDVECRAVDGSVTADVIKKQVSKLKSDDYIVLSSGGNDALSNIEILDNTEKVTSRQLLNVLWNIRSGFSAKFSPLLEKLSGEQRKVLVLTIYNPAFAFNGMEMEDQLAAEAGLAGFNDVIQQQALKYGCDILDIRPLFDSPEDYANPIEPSMKGGEKIAKEISKWVLMRDVRQMQHSE